MKKTPTEYIPQIKILTIRKLVKFSKSATCLILVMALVMEVMVALLAEAAVTLSIVFAEEVAWIVERLTLVVVVAGPIASGLCSIDETEERILCFVGIWNIGYGVIRGDEEGQNHI